jgi:NAD(P)-dependent dehydrogenase (short-subunit alcohol dehydrogenase family)
LDISGKVALVTGAGSGIGRAVAQRLASDGASVVVADIDEAGGQETVARIGDKSVFVRTDVTNEADVRGMIGFAEETFGGLDILHSNAGITSGRPPFPERAPSDWQKVLDINLRGVILGTQFAIQSMQKQGGGVIINTASMAGIGYGFPPDPVYAASKGGVVLFTASLAPLKDAMNIRVNCVCPGVVDTPMFRRGQEQSRAEDTRAREAMGLMQILKPEEIADAVVELISDDSLAGRAMWVRNGRPRELGPMAGPWARQRQ